MGVFNPAVMNGSGGGGGAVDSVSNSDGSLTISPTTGNIVASLNTSHTNTFTTTQRIGNLIIDAGIPPTSTTLSTIGSDSSGNMYFTIGSGMYVYWYNSGNNFMTMGEFGIETLNMQNGIINGLNTINPNPNVTASMNWGGQVSNTPNTTHNSSVINILGTYNNGLGSLEYGIQQQFIQDTFTPTGHLQFSLNNSGTLTSIAKLDQSGNLTTNGYAYIKGKNRNYQQNLTATTTTATTPTLLGTSVGFTPQFSGYLIIDITLRGSNNTLSDGITEGVYQGATSGALTTLLDSETYTQEGLASNEHTFSLHYELSSQVIGTTTYISLAHNAITGGTASSKIVKFTIQEV